MIHQSETPYKVLLKPDKDALLGEFLGKSVDVLRTPAMVIDRKLFAKNCAGMHRKAKDWGASFRAHLKTHKTSEGTRLQLVSEEDQTSAVIVSTMMEAWEVVRAGLVADLTVKDILYGLPVAANKIADLSALRSELQKYGGVVRLLVDHPDQVRFLEAFEKDQTEPKRWSVFVKINGGQNRAGLPPTSEEFSSLVEVLLGSSAITLHGFYGHAGNAYASTSLTQASDYLSGEVNAVNIAAMIALDLISSSPHSPSVTEPFVLSVGSTPTAHAASADARKLLAQALHGDLELHAGNYPMLDLQQQHTGLIDNACIAQRVRTTVISYYHGRGPNGTDEAMVDAGAIAFSKDTGPSGVYGEVIGHPWKLTRISQEHGILTRSEDTDRTTLPLGTMVDIIGQHACLIAAAYPWYYIVDGEVENGTQVVDVWVPWKGW
ncbi:putative serine dehydratase domain-containing protein [Crassisporium funariophilum]|nr:putative serine dehydratase domain-containing protein [Crassisporium funariophilum]